MKDFSDFTDEELIIRYRDGDKQIVDYLMDKYKHVVRSKAGRMFILGADKDDLIQEGMIGLFKAVRDYDSGRDASFLTFAELCISRQMYTAIQAANRKKHLPLNSYISLYKNQEDETLEGQLIGAIQNFSEQNPEEILIDRENVEALQTIIDQELSTFERQVLELSMTGMGYIDIARLLGKDPKSTDNALNRVKTKIRKAIARN
ncbi:MAG: RNA polymerase sporulation sigma factor SigH [Lachnospiraceae bacterium]|nr:RNA polymerase sporulation sigma factor SigH [Lachnospiraceae bacterium]MDD5853586.1 RNA polymerase sporulation sigma factor SigH [Lachnospiraceae bacterium]